MVMSNCPAYLERYDNLRISQHREPNISLRVPAADPVGDSKPGWWIAKKIAEKVGAGKYFNFEDYSEVLDWQLKKIGSSLNEMRNIGVMKFS